VHGSGTCPDRDGVAHWLVGNVPVANLVFRLAVRPVEAAGSVRWLRRPSGCTGWTLGG
jgi:hypothetical protein